jgi:hypothetical protein
MGSRLYLKDEKRSKDHVVFISIGKCKSTVAPITDQGIGNINFLLASLLLEPHE